MLLPKRHSPKSVNILMEEPLKLISQLLRRLEASEVVASEAAASVETEAAMEEEEVSEVEEEEEVDIKLNL